MNESISILGSVEILPLEQTEISPLLTKVKIKVFHLGENRNHSYIDRDTALLMAKTLRGNPIVARYREEKGDFTDHGNEIIINDKGINSQVMTKPYGFVDLNAKVWFEDYNDYDAASGQILKHTYLVTEGMIWTGQYKELQETILDGGRPQSMELDEKTLKGNWSDRINPNYEIFIINDAIITKLCALGEDVEPCFLGANITPDFSLKDDSFVKELLDLRQKFQYALNNNEGGFSMENLDTPVAEETVENFSNNEDNNDKEVSSENKNNTEEFSKKDDSSDKEEQEQEQENDSNKEPSEEEKTSKKEKDSEEDKEKEKPAKNSLNEEESNKYELLKADYDELQSKFTSLEEENKKLLAFKQEVEDKQKDDLIASFYMLSNEDKKDVIANKAQYSLDDIKAKLSIICVDKRVDFSLDKTSEKTATENAEGAPAVYNLDAHEVDTLPAWLKAVENCKEKLDK